MRMRLKSVVSVMLCFLLIFGQVSPLLAVGDIALSENENITNVSKSISEIVYGGTPTSTPEVYVPENTKGTETIGNKLFMAESPTISGTISLPTGVKAPTEGIDLDVYATNGSNTTKVNVSIPSGADKADYTLMVNPASGYKVYYETKNINYVSPMYCGYMGMVRSMSSSAVYDLTDNSKTVDIKLMQMRIISGKLKLADTNESVSINLTAECGADCKTTTVDLKNGEADFAISVPPNSDRGYWLSYSATNNEKIVSNGYYSSEGTVRFRDLATLINVSNNDIKDLSFEVVKKKVISGTISLPDGAVIPDSGVVLSLNATCGIDSVNTTVTVKKDDPTPRYTIYVPQGNEYKVRYELNNFQQYINTGYYSTAGTQSDYAKASSVNVSSQDQNNINIKVIAKSSFSGKVKLPAGFVAPSDGVTVTVWAVSSTANGSTTVTIPENQSSASYTVYVPSGSEYKLIYETNHDNYVSKGFYNYLKTVRDERTATLLDLPVNQSKNIDITLMDKKVISGKIELPSGSADEPIVIRMTAQNGYESYASKDITINEGKSSIDYSILVGPASNYKVKCELITGGIKYIKNTYYSFRSTVFEESFANGVEALTANQPNINFVLMEKRKVTGTISLPENCYAPRNVVITHTDRVDGRVYKTIMPAGSRSVVYTKYMHPQVSINYMEIPDSDIYVNKIYYSDTGTVIDESAATPIDVRNGDAAGKDLVLILKKVVSGKVVLKNGTAPKEGVSVYVNIEGRRDRNRKLVKILPGEKEAEYSMTITPGDDYKLWYESEGNTVNVVSKMFYSKGFMVKTPEEAAPLDLSSGSLSNVILTVHEKRLISGTISIPQGDTIPSDIGMKVLVENTANQYDISATEITMPVSGSVKYNVFVPAENKYTVRYQLNSENNEYVREGYIGLSGTQIDKNSAQIIDVSDSNKTEANMTLIKKRAIKGKVSLPTGIKISSPLRVEIWAGNFSTSVIIPVDGTAQDYILKVAPNSIGSGYKVFYRIDQNAELNTNGYYSKSGMTLNIENADLVDVSSSDRPNTDITIIPKSSIAGKIKLPGGNTATKEIPVCVIVTNGTNTSRVETKILEGTNSTSYLAFVPAGIGYTVKYEIDNSSFVREGYYSLSGTVRDVLAAKQLQVGNENVTGIDLTLIGNTKIEGLVSIPSNRNSPINGMDVEIIASVNGTVKGSLCVRIPQNSKSVPYTLYVPPQDGYKIEYRIGDNTYMQRGYYNSSATTLNLNDATSLNAENNRSQIDITLISKNTINGFISIPAGSDPKTDFVVTMIAENGENSGSVDVLVPCNVRTIPYTIYVPAGGNYVVRCEVRNAPMFMNVFYYNDQVTTVDRASAKVVDAYYDASNINFTLVAKKLISGTIFLKNEFAPYGGLPVRVIARNEAFDPSVEVVIPEGSKSVTYNLYVPSGKNYVLRYETSSEKYVNVGYYTEGNIVRDESLADKIDASTENHVGENITLIGKKEISGVVSINNGTAPFGGVSVYLEANNQKDNGRTSVIIPEGTSSSTFKIYVPEGSDYKIRYEILNSVENFVGGGYYKDTGSVENSENATAINVLDNNKSGIDIKLVPKYLISGTVSLPSGVLAPSGGLRVDVFAANSKVRIGKEFRISEKNNGVDYKIYVPYGLKYKVGYTISSDDYIPGFYNAGGTVMSDIEGQSFNVEGQDVFGINMGVIEKRTISGKISLPADAALPSSPISVDINAGDVRTTVVIPKDKREVSYSLRLPPNRTNTGYILKYNISEAVEEYMSEGYFGLNGTVSNVANSDSIDVSVYDKTDANLTLMEKRIIAGTIITQNKVPAPSSGINVSVFVEGSNAVKDFNITGGAFSTPFKVYVNPGASYKIRYVVNTQGTGFTSTAYYNSLNPVLTGNEASLINVSNEDRNDIQLILVSHNSIKGKVLLSEAAPMGGLSININAQHDNWNNFGTTEVIVPAGSKEAPYTLAVPPASNYKVYYSMKPNEKYVTSAYYNSNGTVLSHENASYLSTLERNETNINITPILKKKISGTVSLPKDFKPSNSVKVIITASSGPYTETVSKVLTSSDPTSNNPTAAYDIYLAPVNGYKISYQVMNNVDLVERGFLTTDNSGLNESKSTIINLSTNDCLNADFTLVMNKQISGTLSILEKAPAAGLDVIVKASNGPYTKETKVIIPAGTNSVDYTLGVPPAPGYVVWYEVSPTTDYFARGFYSGSQVTLEDVSAKKIDVSANDHSGINMRLLNYNSISGTISVPKEKVPNGGLKIEMIAQNNDNKRVKTYTIPESTGTVDFTLYVPNGFGYKLYYTMPENSNFANKAYYSVLGTLLDEAKAMGIDIMSSSKPQIRMNIIEKMDVSGTVSLQNGEKAITDTIVNVSAIDSKNRGNAIRVIIPAGSNSVNYSMKVLPNDQGLGYIMKYETEYDYGFLKSGYYNASAGCRSILNAKVIDASKSNVANVDFVLKHYKTVKGKVLLDKGVAPKNGIKIDIIAKNSIDTASVSVMIPQGSNSADYVLNLPPNDKGDDYVLRYENWIQENYLSIAYYSTSGTTRFENLTERIDISEKDKTGADLTVFEKRIISGIISLPSGEIAPKDGLYVSVSAKNSIDNGMVSVKIPEGKSYAEYILYVPAGRDYQLSYDMPVINEYVMKGYYKSSGTTYKPNDAEILDLTSSDSQGRNITIIKKKIVSGVVSLPDNMTASEDINVNVIAETSGNTKVIIPKGLSTAQYSIYASPSVEGKGRKISYEISSTHGYVKTAYYSYQGMVRNSTLATDVFVNDIDQTNINIKLVLPKKITGKVMLPDGKIAQNDVSIKVTGDNVHDGESTTITIPKGSNSASYVLNLPPNDKGFEYTVKYENWADNMYTLYGYYKSTGTTTVRSQTNLVDINSKDAGNIDLKLMVRRTIKGNINVPINAVIPDQGLDVYVVAQSGFEEYMTIVNIPVNGAGVSYPFEIYVEDGKGYILRYETIDSNYFMPFGYYTLIGTHADIREAEGIDVINSGVSNKDLSLLVKQRINGSIILPDTISNVDGVQLVVSAVCPNGKYSVDAVVNRGSKSADFQLDVPSGDKYIIQYEVKSNLELAPIGYYAEKETVRVEKQAKIFNLTAQGIEDIKLKLLENRLIKGTIKIPVGVAPVNGLKVSVSAISASATSEKEFIIPAGENTIQYVLSVMPVNGYKVKYFVSSEDYAANGYYGFKGTMLQQNSASSVDVSEDNASDINLLLIEKKEIGGKITLPKDFLNSSGLSVTVNAINVKTGVKDSQQITIPKGVNEKEYLMKITPSAEGSVYNVYYQISNAAGLFETGYFNSSITVPDSKLASPIELKYGSYTSANLNLIKSRKITGTVKLPEGELASANGAGVSIYAEKTDYSGFIVAKSVMIPAGSNSAKYELNVPARTTAIAKVNVESSTNGKSETDLKKYTVNSSIYLPVADIDDSSDYKVGFVYTTVNQLTNTYYQTGFYTKKGTVSSFWDSDIINVASEDKAGIDLTIKQRETKISGTIKIPSTANIPGDGIKIRVRALNEKLDYVPETMLAVMNGQNSLKYEIKVPALEKYHVQYSIVLPNEFSGFMESGYYGKEETKGKETIADPVDATNNADGIDMELIQGKEVRGTIKLPTTVNYDSFNIRVTMSNQNNEYSVTVPVGRDGNQTEYRMFLPEGKDYVVRYDVSSLYGEYISTNYYNVAGLTTDVRNAEKIEVKGNVLSTMMLITSSRTINGAIYLPKGNGEVGFSLNVPANDVNGGYNLRYSFESGKDLIDKAIDGFYGSKGTVKDLVSSDKIDVFVNNATNIKMPVIVENYIPLEGIVLNKKNVTIRQGESICISAKHCPTEAVNKMIEWISENTDIARVTSDGRVTAIAQGETYIRAIGSDSVYARCKIIVTEAVKNGMNLDKSEIYINANESESLKTIIGSDISVESVVWTSSDEKIVSVAQDGSIKAIGSGEAIITASSKDNPTIAAACKVFVIVPVSEIKINDSDVSVIAGQKKTLQATVSPNNATIMDIDWSSSDTSVATIIENSGKIEIQAIKAGTTVITAKSIYNSAVKSSVTVTVLPVPVESVKIVGESNLVMTENTQSIVKAVVMPLEVENRIIDFVSSDVDKVTVGQPVLSSDGQSYEVIIQAKSPTSNNNPVILTATSRFNKTMKAEFSITVKRIEVTSLQIKKPTPITVDVNKKVNIVAEVNPADATNRNNIVWSSDNTSAVTVVGMGGYCVVTGKSAAKSVKIIAKLTDGDKEYTDSCYIEVKGDAIAVVSPTPTVGVSATPPAIVFVTPTPTPKVTATPTSKATTTPTATPTATPKSSNDIKIPTVTPKTVEPSATKKPSSSGSGIDKYIDISGHWAYENFALLLEKGIIGGYSDNTLRPKKEITRAEMAKILVIAAGFEPSSSTNLTCKDKNKVPTWAKSYVKAAMDAKIINGYSDKTFRPNDKVTRKEMAVMVMKAFGYQEVKNAKLNFKDSNKVPNWANGYIAAAVDAGIMQGYNDKTIKPDKTITRAEAVAMIARCIQ